MKENYEKFVEDSLSTDQFRSLSEVNFKSVLISSSSLFRLKLLHYSLHLKSQF